MAGTNETTSTADYWNTTASHSDSWTTTTEYSVASTPAAQSFVFTAIASAGLLAVVGYL